LFLGTTGWVYVAFGQAKQAFTTPVRLEGSSGPTLNDFFSLGDVDGDGVVDVSAQDGGQIATHYLAKGAATLRSNSYFAADLRLEFVADMNGDGRCDLVGATSTGAVGVALTQSDGTPHSVTPYHDGATTWMGEVHQADINGDGAVDVVSAADLTHLYVMFGNGDGSVGTPVVSDDGGTQFAYFRLADLDGDGALDAVCFGEPDKYQLLHGTKDGTFQPWSSNLPSSLAIYGIAVADFDADGRPDIAITNGNSTYVFLNAGP
jgi:hypothetical protein